jgi:4-amino-4-deoxy-L-arabinose transferase-like glycosyltransferase
MKIHWKTVMFVAVIGMLLGLAVSIWGIGHENIKAAWIGLVLIVAVCVSWWFWVMLIIRTMIDCSEKTQQGLGEIKYDLREVRHMIQDLDSSDKR